MQKPDGLYCFPPVPSRIFGHLRADFRDALQFFFPLRVGFFVGHRMRQFCMPFGISYCRIDGNQYGLIEVSLLF